MSQLNGLAGIALGAVLIPPRLCRRLRDLATGFLALIRATALGSILGQELSDRWVHEPKNNRKEYLKRSCYQGFLFLNFT
jgi:hypothetical protein